MRCGVWPGCGCGRAVGGAGLWVGPGCGWGRSGFCGRCRGNGVLPRRAAAGGRCVARRPRDGGLRGGAARPAAAEGRRRGAGARQAEEEESEGEGADRGADREQQEAGGGEEARPGQAHPGAGGLREDAGEAANGEDPEEGLENPQAESGGLQQTLGHSDGALRHSQSQLDQVKARRFGALGQEPCPWGGRVDPCVLDAEYLIHLLSISSSASFQFQNTEQRLFVAGDLWGQGGIFQCCEGQEDAPLCPFPAVAGRSLRQQCIVPAALTGRRTVSFLCTRAAGRCLLCSTRRVPVTERIKAPLSSIIPCVCSVQCVCSAYSAPSHPHPSRAVPLLPPIRAVPTLIPPRGARTL